MNPIITPLTPTSCSVCFEETMELQVQWHRPQSPTQRAHTTCVDCAAQLCFHSMTEDGHYPLSVQCPDCRNIVILNSKSASTQNLYITSWKISAVFLFLKLAAEPKYIKYLNSLSSKDFIRSLVDSWTFTVFDASAFHNLENTISTLAGNGQLPAIAEALRSQFATFEVATNITFATLYIFLLSLLKLEQGVLKQNFKTIVFSNIQLLFYYLIIKTFMLDPLKNNISNEYLSNPLQQFVAHQSHSYEYIYIITTLAILPPIFGQIIHMITKTILSKTLEDIKKDFLNNDLLISQEHSTNRQGVSSIMSEILNDIL